MNILSIVLCAGKGDRLKSGKSKMLHEISGRPLCCWSVANAKAISSLPPLVVVGYQASLVEEALNKHFNNLNFIHQTSLDGTGGAVKAAISKIPDQVKSVLITCGDAPLLKLESLKKLITIQKNSHVPIAMLSSVLENPFGYGRIIRNKANQICAIVEEREASFIEKEIKEVNPSVYVFDVEFLKSNIDKLKKHEEKGEYFLTDLISLYLKDGASFGPVESLNVSDEEIRGINNRKELAYAEEVINGRIIDHWMNEGVTFIAPKSAIVEQSVKLSVDNVIYPNVHLKGDTHIGEGSIIENGSIINNSIVGQNCHILPYSLIDSSKVGDNSQVGPFARLRPDSHLETEVKIGNFVEIKSSHIKSKSKINHLSYVGDAVIGEETNIGAGSITCNWDGTNKHKTVIGNKAFIGSNSTLVAPLNIGDQAYIAGGSVINEDVPSKILAFGRARQVNKPKK